MSLEAEKYARITLSHARTTIQCGWIRCEEDLPDNCLIGALPFLPNGDVDMAWTLLRPTLPPEMSSFADYMDYTWIGTSSRAPLFNQWSWNQWDDTLLGIPRSSNIAEGWHNGFKSLVGCFHPTIWKLLEALKLEQAITDTKFCNHLMRIEESPSSKAEEMGPT